MIALAIAGIVVSIAVPAFDRYRERGRLVHAVADIGAMGVEIRRFLDDNRRLPDSLAEVGLAGRLDPWGFPYRYHNIEDDRGKGGARKDRRLNPLNSDFDLYSVGRDGLTKLPLPPKESHDDVVRARNGRFIGFAKDFEP